MADSPFEHLTYEQVDKAIEAEKHGDPLSSVIPTEEGRLEYAALGAYGKSQDLDRFADWQILVMEGQINPEWSTEDVERGLHKLQERGY